MIAMVAFGGGIIVAGIALARYCALCWWQLCPVGVSGVGFCLGRGAPGIVRFMSFSCFLATLRCLSGGCS